MTFADGLRIVAIPPHSFENRYKICMRLKSLVTVRAKSIPLSRGLLFRALCSNRWLDDPAAAMLPSPPVFRKNRPPLMISPASANF